MRLEIANPSDKATIDCTNMLAARLAILVLSNGKYGIIGDETDNGMPPFLFGGHDEWFVKNHGMTVEQAFNECPPEDIATALESVQLEGERSSLNDFTKRAHELAKILRKPKAEAQNKPA